MRSRRLTFLVAVTSLALLGPGGCARESEAPTSPVAPNAERRADAAVYATFHPVAYFAERIAAGLVRVVCPIPQGQNPAEWRPSREQISEFQNARVVLANGAGFETWLATASLPESRLVETARGFGSEFITMAEVTHSHGARGEHSHGGANAHTWMDPVNARRQAEAVRAALVRAFPEHAREFEQNAAGLLRDLDDLDQRFKDVSARMNGAILIASHPAYRYPARRYGWNLESVDIEPDRPIDAAMISEVVHALDHAGDIGAAPRIMLWESEPAPESAEILGDRLSMTSVVFSPCENPDADDRAAGRTFLSMMRDNLDRLRAALESASSN